MIWKNLKLKSLSQKLENNNNINKKTNQSRKETDTGKLKMPNSLYKREYVIMILF